MKITETALKSVSSTESFARGNELYRSGAIYDAFRQGNVLTGKCEGSSAPFYQLRVTIDEGGIQERLPALALTIGAAIASTSSP